MTDEPTGREGWQHATPLIMVAVYVLGPLAVIPLFGQTAATAVIVLIFGTAFIAGLIDALTFRFTWSLPVIAVAGFALAKALYFNDGTFIYALGCFALAAAGGGVGAAVAKKRAR